MNSDIIKGESMEFIRKIDQGFPPDEFKKDYFEYIKQHVIVVLLALTKDFREATHDEVFDYLDIVDEDRAFFHYDVFERISYHTIFFDIIYWNEIIELHHLTFNQFKPGWWEDIRLGGREWNEIRYKAIQLLKKLNIPQVDSLDYADEYLDDEILIKITKHNTV